MLKGKVATRSGEASEKSVVNEVGGFLFVPPNLPQQAVNLSQPETAGAIAAHNDFSESETVVRQVPEA